MPYIEQHYREILDTTIETLAADIDCSLMVNQAGLINYTIARLIFQLLRRRGFSYTTLNEMIGALECCKLELYRRVAANYENEAMKRNGDVFDD